LGDFGSTTHSNTDIGLLNGRGVIDTITSDSDDFSKSLASVNNEEFLGRSGSSENNFGLSNPVHDKTSLLNLSIIHTFFSEVNFGKLITVNDDRLAFLHSIFFGHAFLVNEMVVFLSFVRDDRDLGGNSSSSVLLISSNHNNLDTGGFTFLDSQIDTRARRIVKRDETDEGKIPHGEPSLLVTSFLVVFLYGGPSFPFLSAEHIGFLELLRVEGEAGETQNTLSHVTEESVSALNSTDMAVSHRNNFASFNDGVTSNVNSIGSTLEEDAKVIFGVSGLLRLRVHVSDHKVEFNVRREFDFVRSIGVVLVNKDGARFSVRFESFSGVIFFVFVECDLIIFVVLEFSKHERDNEFKESSLRSISLNRFIQPFLL